MAKVSNCCGDIGTRVYHNRKRHGDSDDITTYQDVELCGKCGEHCEYLEEDTRDVDHALDLFGKLGEFFNPKTNQDTLNKITQKIKS